MITITIIIVIITVAVLLKKEVQGESDLNNLSNCNGMLLQKQPRSSKIYRENAYALERKRNV